MNLTTSCAAVVILVVAILLISVDLNDGQSSTRSPRRRQQGNRRSRGRNNNNTTTGGRRGRTNNNTRNAGRRGRNRGGSPPGCEEIYLPMCKGLIGYTHTKLPNQFNHTTQLEVYRHLEHLWSYMDHSCSKNMRLLVCSKYLPKCTRSGPALGPCKKTCMVAKRKCARPLNELLSLSWQEKFRCTGLPTRRCIKPLKDTRCRNSYPTCKRNAGINVCSNLTFTWGTLPNMFHQCQEQEINKEMEHYNSLISTNCHLDLRFMLCGVYSPYCVRNNEIPFTFPCRELCDEIRGSCESRYRSLNHNLPWPAKLQCHRLPLSNDTYYECVMPREGSIFGAS